MHRKKYNQYSAYLLFALSILISIEPGFTDDAKEVERSSNDSLISKRPLSENDALKPNGMLLRSIHDSLWQPTKEDIEEIKLLWTERAKELTKTLHCAEIEPDISKLRFAPESSGFSGSYGDTGVGPAFWTDYRGAKNSFPYSEYTDSQLIQQYYKAVPQQFSGKPHLNFSTIFFYARDLINKYVETKKNALQHKTTPIDQAEKFNKSRGQ